MKHRIFQAHTQSGITLIEVLISILVVNIGLLGLAGLFINSLKSTNEGYLYSQVVALTYDMTDRIRANPSALNAYTNTPTTKLAKDCAQATCSPRELAAYDLFTWKQQLDIACLLYTSPSPRDPTASRMPSSA